VTTHRTRPLHPTRRWLDRPTLSIGLGAGWLLLQQSVSVTNLITAVVLGIVLPRLAHPFLGPVVRPRRVDIVLRLVAVVAWDVVVSNVIVARLVLTPARQPRPAWIRIPLELRDPLAQVWLASIVTNTPGTVSCNIDEQTHELTVHVLDCDDPAPVIAQIRQRYEKPLKEILG
jgi:multicomponent K+:H+ antiporter subunit E